MAAFGSTPAARVLIIHTGGTFGAKLQNSHGQEHPSPEESEELLQQEFTTAVPEILRLADVTVRFLCQLDSTNLNAKVWSKIGDLIQGNWESFDGFVVIHGTDTLAYMASFLSLTLTKLTKPIVITGSQRPLAELRSDARMNLIDAIELASLGHPGVVVSFDSDVYLGSRVTKTSTLNLGAFRSPNYPSLGHLGVERSLRSELLTPIPWSTEPPIADFRHQEKVMALFAVPGGSLDEGVATALLNAYQGFLLVGFGAGHFPTEDGSGSWVRFCEEAQEREIPVIACSQCPEGKTELTTYEVGRKLAQAGVIPALDMTRECATMKLMIMLGRCTPFKSREAFMMQPLANEVSPPRTVHYGKGEKP